MKKRTNRMACGIYGVWAALALVALTLVFPAGACKNVWMEDIVAPLYEEEKKGFGLPALTGVVIITGTVAADETLTANTASLGGSGTISYQWKRDGADIIGATGESCILVSTDSGATITVTVTRADNSGSVTSDPVIVPFDDIAAIAAYLTAASGGTAADDPVPLPVDIQLSGAAWTGLLQAIEDAGRYVALDLSACTKGTPPDSGSGLRSDGIFDPGNTFNTGKERIVSLTLPDEASGITAGNNMEAAFLHFDALREIRAAAVTDIGDYAFAACTALTSVSLPAATDIGHAAFAVCTALTSVSLPAVENIGIFAFTGAGLTSVNLPASLTGTLVNPFKGCVNLVDIQVDSSNSSYKGEGGMLLNKAGDTLIAYPGASGMVVVPEVTAVGPFAFSGCTALTSVILPKVTNIGVSAFSGTGTAALTVVLPQAAPGITGLTESVDPYSKTVTIKTPAGRTGYDTVWQASFRGTFGNGATVTLNFEDL
jgi:hypothetical protein